MASMFSHRHYEAIAALLAETKREHSKHSAELSGLSSFESKLCGLFAGDNPRFNVIRFTKAATIDKPK